MITVWNQSSSLLPPELHQLEQLRGDGHEPHLQHGRLDARPGGDRHTFDDQNEMFNYAPVGIILDNQKQKQKADNYIELRSRAPASVDGTCVGTHRRVSELNMNVIK